MCSTFEAFDIKLQGHRENNQVLVKINTEEAQKEILYFLKQTVEAKLIT
jgi:hypothetical protein